MSEFDDMFRDHLGSGGFGASASSVRGKKLVKYGKGWIVLAKVTNNTYLCVQGGTTPPCPVYLLRAEEKELLSV
jgi:hypothetical protein